MYKANLKVKGKELTVHFEVDTRSRRPTCLKCDFSNQAGIVTIKSIVHDGVDIGFEDLVWARAQSRLDKLFQDDLCSSHLGEVAWRRKIVLEDVDFQA